MRNTINATITLKIIKNITLSQSTHFFILPDNFNNDLIITGANKDKKINK
jgi:hypothetical protein